MSPGPSVTLRNQQGATEPKVRAASPPPLSSSFSQRQKSGVRFFVKPRESLAANAEACQLPDCEDYAVLLLLLLLLSGPGGGPGLQWKSRERQGGRDESQRGVDTRKQGK